MKTSIRAIVIIVLTLISINLSAQEYQWGHSFGTSEWEEGLWIDHDSQGNIYTIGYFYGTIDFDPSADVTNLISSGNSDGFVASYDQNGNFRWAFSFGGSDYDLGMSIAVYSNYVYITGYFLGTADFDPSANAANRTSNGQADVFVACYDTDGNFQWVNAFGSTGWDMGSRVKTNPDGNPIATGNFNGTVDFDPSGNTANLTEFGSGDCWIAKYDANGVYQWAINPGGAMFDAGNGITIDNNGYVYVIGNFFGTIDADPSANVANLTSNGISDISLLSYDNDGNYRWAHNIGGTMSDIGWSVTHQVNDAGDMIFFTGSFEGSADFDPSVNDNTLTSFGGADIFVSGFFTNGAHSWANNYGGPNYDGGYSIDADQTELVWVTGEYGGDGNLKMSARNTSSNSFGRNDNRHSPKMVTNQQFGTGGLLLLALSSPDHFPLVYAIAFLYDQSGTSFGNAVAAHNPVYVIGEYTGTIDLDGSDNTASFTSNGQADIFIAKYSQNPLAVEESNAIPESFELYQNYPNPFNPTTTINYELSKGTVVRIDILDLQGKIVNTIFSDYQEPGSHSIEWNARDYDGSVVGAGIYFYRLQAGEFNKTKKMVLLR